MILSALIIFIVAGIAYTWGSRGFFSALLHLACVLAGGAIAFALWEPVAYLILKQAGNSQWIIDLAWGAGLAVPFAVSVALLRVIVDKLVPANVDLEGMSSLVGGIVCGAIAGTITAGIFLIAMSFLRLPPKSVGFAPVVQNTNGAPVIQSKLVFPADRLTAWLYGYTSEASLKSEHPLAIWRPTVTVDGALMRTTFNEGGSRHALAPRAFSLTRRFTVGKEGSIPVNELLKDGFSTGTPKATDLMGNDISPSDTNHYIEGFVVSFGSAAREREGAVVIGNTQVQLVCYNEAEGTSISIHPVAVSSKAENPDSEDKKIHYGRWRFERPNTYIRSVGGTDNALMGFEFLVPKGYTPIALYVKGVREDVTRLSEGDDYPTNKARDEAIGKGTALGGEPGTPGLLVYKDPDRRTVIINADEGEFDRKPISVTNAIPRTASTAVILSKDNIGNLLTNSDRQIIGGEQKYRVTDLQKNKGIDGKLQVRLFYDGEDTKIVQVNFSRDSKLGPVVNFAAQEATGEITLTDHRGERYPCIGFAYFDSQLVHIRFTPEATIRSKEELPFGGPSTSRPDQSYTLIFRVANGAKITGINIGSTTIGELKPELLVK